MPFVFSKGNALYDRYLGTGVGLSELGVVYDETYELDKYELVAVRYKEDRAEENMLLVVAQPDEDGRYAQQSLVLTGRSLAANFARADCLDFFQTAVQFDSVLCCRVLTGEAAKFLDWALEDPEAARPEEARELPEAKLTTGQLSDIRIEVRIAPDKQDGYRFGVYAWYADVQQAIDELTPSFQVCISAGEQGGAEERAAYAATHGLSATDDETGAVEYLQSALIEMPVGETEERTDSVEYFSVNMEDGPNPIVLFDPAMPLDNFRRWSLCADWIGDTAYRLEVLEAEQ